MQNTNQISYSEIGESVMREAVGSQRPRLRRVTQRIHKDHKEKQKIYPINLQTLEIERKGHNELPSAIIGEPFDCRKQ